MNPTRPMNYESLPKGYSIAFIGSVVFATTDTVPANGGTNELSFPIVKGYGFRKMEKARLLVVLSTPNAAIEPAIIGANPTTQNAYDATSPIRGLGDIKVYSKLSENTYSRGFLVESDLRDVSSYQITLINPTNSLLTVTTALTVSVYQLIELN